jgi:hypothetical protein
VYVFVQRSLIVRGTRRAQEKKTALKKKINK